MISLIVGFILPFLVWILTLPLKLSVKILDKSLKFGTNRVIQKHEGLRKLEENWNNSKVRKTGKIATKSIKAGFVVAKFATKTTINSLRLLVKVVDATVRSLIWLASITSMLYTVTIAGAIISIVAVSVIVINIGADDTETKEETKQETGNTTMTGYDFMSIDWSKDFNKQLDQVEDKNGVEARNWVELSIIQMNTMQRGLKDKEIDFAVSGFMTGLKGVESGQTSLASKANLLNQEVKASNGTTPMQFDTAWQKYNPYYTDYQRSKEGSKYYYPDAFFGISKRFSSAGTKGFLPDRTNPLYERAFSDMGVEKTPAKLQFVRYIGNITNEYNAVFLESSGYVSGLTKESANDTVYANAMVIIQFGELYGYTITDKTVDLVKSMYAKNAKDTNYKNWYFDKTSAMKSIYGLYGGNKSFPSDVDKTTDYGVITEKGEKVKGSLFNYLVEKMPSKAKDAVWGSEGLRVYNASRSHYMRARYDLTAYLMGVYDLWWASNALGVQADLK